MLKYYLDKTGKVIKSILFPSSEFVDTEPREGSMNPLASGAVANVMPQDASKDNPLMTAEDTERMIDAMKPIDAMTLRFEFSKKDYSPVVAGVGSAGTWTKVDSPTLNVWDWENTNTDWTESFRGAFPDADNGVRVIAAGDTSSVTKFRRIFAGTYTSLPAQTNYSLTARNNIIECCPFSLDGVGTGVSDAAEMFAGSYLKKPVVFDYSNVDDISISQSFADTMITEIGDMNFSVALATGLFSRCSKLKKVGIITFDKNKLSTTYGLGLFNCASSSQESVLEEVGGIRGTGNLKVMDALFGYCSSLTRVTEEIDCSSATSFNATFAGCRAIENLPVLKNLGQSAITSTALMFSGCYKLKKHPTFDTSSVTDFHNMFVNNYEMETVPDLDFSSATNVASFVRGCKKAKFGITETYNKFLDRGAAITSHSRAFENCGSDTPQGRAALAQIPQSWGGLAEG